ncbi:MAG: SRPBCC domain-containing protein [Pseudomonadota bacterium]
MSAAPDTRRLRMTRYYDAPRDLVWEVWTNPQHLAAWWGPFGPDATSSTIDARVGGEFLVSMQAPDGSEHPSRGVIKAIDPPEKIVIEGDANAGDACGAGLPPGATVTISFEAEGNGTRLTLTTVFASVEALHAADASGYTASWSQTLDALGAYFVSITEGVS